MTKLVGLLLFLVFACDARCAYEKHLGAPLGWAQPLLLDPLPIKVRPFDLVLLGVLIFASLNPGRAGPVVRPMKNMLLVVLGTTVVCFVYGLARGGVFRFASWQTYLILSTVLVAFTIAATFRTPAAYYGLARWLLAAALYRAVMCWIPHFTWGRNIVGETGAYLTSHDDTIGWVISILVLIVHAVERRSLLVTWRNVAAIVFLLGAIQFNSRRLAWVSLAMALIVAYAFIPQGRAKRRIQRVGWFVLPVVLLYVVVGWGSQARIFLPLRSLSSVSTEEDVSTLARNAENLGLIATAGWSNYALGTGWGHPYVYLTMKYDISGFELWRYVPHNSILGLLAFTGVLGFAGFWLAIPTAVFLNARVARLAADPRARTIGLVAVAQLVVSANQLYGDMGIFSLQSMYAVGVAYAVALRMPRIAGVWGATDVRAAES